MASPVREDVLVMDARNHFDTWLNDLPQISEQQSDAKIKGRCDCNSDRCVLSRLATPFNAEKTPISVIELPCGCRFRKACAERLFFNSDRFSFFFSNDRYPPTRCPVCKFELFPLRTIGEWISDEAKKVEIESLEEEDGDRSCGICRLEFGSLDEGDAQAEQPLKLPCQHVFGDQCIKTWLGAGSAGAATNRRSCPTCREELFVIRSSHAGSEDIGLGRSASLMGMEYHRFDVNWALLQLDIARNYWL